MKESQWGGARKGAGRPSESKEPKVATIVARVSPAQKASFEKRGASRWLRSILSEKNEELKPEKEFSYVCEKRYEGVPFYMYSLQAGYAEEVEPESPQIINFNELLVQDSRSTVVLRVSGQSMIEAGIDDGDLVVVDRRRQASNGDIVVMQINNEFTLKRLIKKGNSVYLKAENTSGKYSDIYPSQGDEWRLFGVVNYAIKAFNGRL